MKRFYSLIAVLIVVTAVLVLLIVNVPFAPTATTLQATTTPKTYELVFAHNTPTNSALHEASVEFAKRVHTKSNGRVTIEVFPAQKLGDDYQMLQKAQKGSIDILLTPTAKLSVLVPSMQFVDLPFFFPAPNDVYTILDSQVGRLLLDKLHAINLIGITFWENGFKHFTADAPLERIEDFKGKKFRVMKSRIIMDQFLALDAKPVLIDFHKTRQALLDKVVDGQENPLVAIASMNIHQAQSHLTLSNHAYLGYVMSINKERFNTLPLDIQNIIMQTAKEVTVWERKETKEREDTMLQTIAKNTHIHTLSQEARKEFAQRLEFLPHKYEAEIGTHIVSKAQEMLHDMYNENHVNEIHIGLNLDLSQSTADVALQIKRGAHLAIRQINQAGGIKGKQLVLIAKDAKQIQSRSIENAQSFVTCDATKAVIVGKHAPTVCAQYEVLKEANIAMLGAYKTCGTPNSNAFMFGASFEAISSKIANDTALHYKRVAIVANSDEEGRAQAQILKQKLLDLGVTTTPPLFVTVTASSLKADYQELLTQKPQTVILLTGEHATREVFKVIAQSNSILPIIGHFDGLYKGIYTEFQELFDRLNVKFIYTHLGTTHKARELFAHYKSYYQTNRVAHKMAVMIGYDSVLAVAQAIKQAPSEKREDILRALRNIDTLNGALKIYNTPFKEGMHALNKEDIFWVHFDKDGGVIQEDAL